MTRKILTYKLTHLRRSVNGYSPQPVCLPTPQTSGPGEGSCFAATRLVDSIYAATRPKQILDWNGSRPNNYLLT